CRSVRALQVDPKIAPFTRREAAETEILENGHARQHAASLRDVDHVPAGDLMDRQSDELLAEEADRALARAHAPGEGAKERRLPGAVGADQRDDAGLRHGQAHALESADPSVAHVQVANLEERAVASPCQGRPRSPADLAAPGPAAPRRSSARS